MKFLSNEREIALKFFSLRYISHSIVLAGSLLSLNAVAASPELIENLRVGNEVIHFPVPSLFTALPKDAVLYAAREASTPPPRRLLAFMMPTDDIQKTLEGIEVRFVDNITVQTGRAEEANGMTREAFVQSRKQIRSQLSAQFEAAKQQKDRAEEVSRAMSGAIGAPIKLSVSEAVLLGIFEESETSISFAFLSTVVAETNEGRDVEPTVVAQSIALVKNRPLWILTRLAYRDNRDIERAKMLSKSILTKVRTTN